MSFVCSNPCSGRFPIAFISVGEEGKREMRGIVVYFLVNLLSLGHFSIFGEVVKIMVILSLLFLLPRKWLEDQRHGEGLRGLLFYVLSNIACCRFIFNRVVLVCAWHCKVLCFLNGDQRSGWLVFRISTNKAVLEKKTSPINAQHIPNNKKYIFKICMREYIGPEEKWQKLGGVWTKKWWMYFSTGVLKYQYLWRGGGVVFFLVKVL